MSERITLQQLEERLLDLDHDRKDLKQYFIGDARGTIRGAPGVTVDRALVEVPDEQGPALESAVLSQAFTDFARARRAKEYRRDVEKKPNRDVLVSEGDSWFQFPWLLEDVIDQLHDEHGFATRCVSEPGDTLANMLAKEEYLRALEDELHAGRKVRAFLFSGAGNDIIGSSNGVSVLEQMIHPFDPEKSTPADYAETELFATQLALIERGYRQIIAKVRSLTADLPILIHGYDWSLPGGHPDDPRHPIYAAQDNWLGRPFARLGIHDETLQRGIIKYLIDKLYERMQQIADSYPDKGVRVVDCRGAVEGKSSWNDEIHPRDPGFATVATRFAAAI